jgi:hypothetical protein
MRSFESCSFRPVCREGHVWWEGESWFGRKQEAGRRDGAHSSGAASGVSGDALNAYCVSLS